MRTMVAAVKHNNNHNVTTLWLINHTLNHKNTATPLPAGCSTQQATHYSYMKETQEGRTNVYTTVIFIFWRKNSEQKFVKMFPSFLVSATKHTGKPL